MSMDSAPKSRSKKGMDKDNFMKMQPQTVLRVNMQCQCEGCAGKIRSVLKKIKGVETCRIDLEQGKVTVIGDVHPAKLIEKLSKKTEKHVELWGFPKAMNNLNNQMNKIQIVENGKGGKGMKPQKKGGGGDDQEMAFHKMFPQMLNAKGSSDFKMPQLKDMKLPSKDRKAVKFQLPDHDYDDEGGSDDELFDESDDDHDGFDGHGVHGGGATKSIGVKKGFSISSVPFLKRLGSKKQEKNDYGRQKGGGNQKGGKGENQIQNQNHGGGKKGGDLPEQGKNGGGKRKGGNNGGRGGGGNDTNSWSLNGGQKNGGGQALNNMQHKFQNIDVSQLGAGARNMGQMGRMGNHPMGQMDFDAIHHGTGGRNMGQMGQMSSYPMGQMGNFPAMGGPPVTAVTGSGHYPGMAAPSYPYNQQQYMAMMMNQRQPYGNGMYNPMVYGRPQQPMNYGLPPTPPQAAAADNFTHYFNDENTNSCRIM